MLLGPLYAKVLVPTNDASRQFVASLPRSDYYLDIWPTTRASVEWPPVATMAGNWAPALEIWWARGNPTTNHAEEPEWRRRGIEAAGFDGRGPWPEYPEGMFVAGRDTA